MDRQPERTNSEPKVDTMELHAIVHGPRLVIFKYHEFEHGRNKSACSTQQVRRVLGVKKSIVLEKKIKGGIVCPYLAQRYSIPMHTLLAF